MYRLCGGIDGWVEHGAGACVCVYVCIHVHISMYRLCGRIDVSLVWLESSASIHMFYMGVSSVCVYVCLHVHISMYRLCGRIDSWVEVRGDKCFAVPK